MYKYIHIYSETTKTKQKNLLFIIIIFYYFLLINNWLLFSINILSY